VMGSDNDGRTMRMTGDRKEQQYLAMLIAHVDCNIAFCLLYLSLSTCLMDVREFVTFRAKLCYTFGLVYSHLCYFCCMAMQTLLQSLLLSIIVAS
jgi:hypothetical protein